MALQKLKTDENFRECLGYWMKMAGIFTEGKEYSEKIFYITEFVMAIVRDCDIPFEEIEESYQAEVRKTAEAAKQEVRTNVNLVPKPNI